MNIRHNSAPRRIPTVVTFLEMRAKPAVLAPLPKGKIVILRAEHPPVHFYRYLYDTIGAPYHWVDRKKLADEALAKIIQAPQVELYVLHVDGCPGGMAELDFSKDAVCNLAYFGLTPECIGRGLGFFFLQQTVELAWTRPIQRYTVNTCTLDHRRALPLYQRVGFVPYSREERYIELP
ncbi:MAG: GNAT family N-acetyltransferase [Alphaproteobacteria bacterium]|nr:GNAT family N-acetyltransferase [Alphaproteobacteria bacterium]MBV9061925.1 GNAT family N-acetyltransferase [Alphaproteobacteria bacterium]